MTAIARPGYSSSIVRAAVGASRAWLGVGALLCAACSGAPARDGAGDAQVQVDTGPVRLEQRITSVRARRDAGVVRQLHDYSCGSAALATLLSYGLNEPVSEQELLGELLHSLSAEQIGALQKNGLSLTELRELAQQHGHRAQGFRIHQSQLERLIHPVIVHVRPGGYNHFAVLKRARNGQVDLADPSLGNVRMPLYRFLEMWADAQGYGVLLAVEPASGPWPEQYALQGVGGSDAPVDEQRVLRLTAPAGPQAAAISRR